MVTYVNAAGVALDPLIIHRGVMKETWLDDKPNGFLVRGSKKGYINKKLFCEYGKNLVIYCAEKNQLEGGNLLLLDSHYSHTFNFGFMKIMWQNRIKVMALECHSSHFLQPLDKNPFSSFKNSFNYYLRKWNRKHGGRPIRPGEFFSVFNKAWVRGMTRENIIAGFKCTGIFPVSMNRFPRELFTIGQKPTGVIQEEPVWLDDSDKEFENKTDSENEEEDKEDENVLEQHIMEQFDEPPDLLEVSDNEDDGEQTINSMLQTVGLGRKNTDAKRGRPPKKSFPVRKTVVAEVHRSEPEKQDESDNEIIPPSSPIQEKPRRGRPKGSKQPVKRTITEKGRNLNVPISTPSPVALSQRISDRIKNKVDMEMVNYESSQGSITDSQNSQEMEKPKENKRIGRKFTADEAMEQLGLIQKDNSVKNKTKGKKKPVGKPVPSTSKESEPEAINKRVFYKKSIATGTKSSTANVNEESALDVVRRNKAIDAAKKVTKDEKGKSIKDFFPPLGEAPPKKKRKTLHEQLPSVVYTDPDTMEVIRRRDKNSDDDYVKQYERELKEELKKINKKK